MTITTLSSRELTQAVRRAKKATRNGPVFITDRGKPAHVLLSFEDYQRLTAEGKLGEAGQRLEALKRTLETLANRK